MPSNGSEREAEIRADQTQRIVKMLRNSAYTVDRLAADTVERTFATALPGKDA